MRIPAYQIHNILKMYGKQLTRDRMDGQQEAEAGLPLANENPKLSAEGKRKAVISKVAADIVERITRSGPQSDIDHQLVHQLEEELGKKIDFKALDGPKIEFVYNTFTKDNEKVTQRLSLDDANFLINRLEYLAEQIVDKSLESG